jgi:phage shock protein A
MTDKSTGKSYTTATGARQWTKDITTRGESAKALRDAESRIQKDFTKLSSKAFKEKYGVKYIDAISRLSAASNAMNSQNIKEISGGKSNSATRMYDRNEKRWENTRKEAAPAKKEKSKYAKGGMVKANCGASVPPNRKAKK